MTPFAIFATILSLWVCSVLPDEPDFSVHAFDVYCVEVDTVIDGKRCAYNAIIPPAGVSAVGFADLTVGLTSGLTFDDAYVMERAGESVEVDVSFSINNARSTGFQPVRLQQRVAIGVRDVHDVSLVGHKESIAISLLVDKIGVDTSANDWDLDWKPENIEADTQSLKIVSEGETIFHVIGRAIADPDSFPLPVFDTIAVVR